MNENSSPLMGEVKEALGAVTGDREVEAEGRAEQRAADPDDPVDEVICEVVAQETHEVRQDHNDTL